jgi:hypothetical protein
MSDKLVLEIEVPGFNADGIREACENESEPGAPYTPFDYLFDADLMRTECVVAVVVPTGGMPISGQEGRIINARLEAVPQ